MKHLHILVFCLLFCLPMAKIHAQPALKAVNTIVIHTSATCEECKVFIESAVNKVKGVKTSNLNLETFDVTVTYANWKTDEDIIRTAISKAGYDADQVKADQEAYDNLPKCCKKGAEE